VKYENGNLFADSNHIWNRFTLISSLNTHVKLTAEQLVPEPSCFGVESAVERLEIYTWSGSDQITIIDPSRR
jgi:hypothetical protein